ncbi:hypothetical protein ILYODFUR_002495 [Ilyodon furcidens]|uniref:Uncharacterized protein n=1 Tax=Ilyodon furcidens TaxID=33524 RepID=A0ABV0UFI1_9TELE
MGGRARAFLCRCTTSISAGFPVLTSGVHWKAPEFQAIYLLTQTSGQSPPRRATLKLISLTSVQPVHPPTLKPKPSDFSCLIALLIHLTHSDLTLDSRIPLTSSS